MKKGTFNSITFKNSIKILAIGIVLNIAISFILPTTFYSMLRPYISQYVSSSLDSVSARISYLLSMGNTRLQRTARDEAYADLIDRYYTDDQEKEDIARQLGDSFNRYNTPQRSTTVVAGSTILLSNGHFLLETDKGDFFHKNGDTDFKDALLQTEWYDSFKHNGEGVSYSPSFMVYKDGQPIEVFAYVLSFETRTTTCNAYMIYEFEVFKEQMEILEKWNLTDYALVGSRGETLYTALPAEQSRISLSNAPSDFLAGEQYVVKEFTGKQCMTFSVLCSYSNEGLRLVLHAPVEDLLSNYKVFFWFVRLVLLLFFTLFILSVYIVLRSISTRLVRLSHKMERVRDLEYNVSLDDAGKDEIGQIGKLFNEMVAKIRTNAQELIRRRQKESEMEYSLSVAEIDPHYIYNVLYTVNHLAREKRCDEIIEINKALTFTLKDHVKTKKLRTFDSVEKELAVIENYILIQRYLFSYDLSLSVEVAESDMDLQIPKDILQPLVENAIKHGLLPHREQDPPDARIAIAIKREDAQIRIKVSDNGVGMNPQTQQQYFVGNTASNPYEDDPHIGIQNLRRRLEYLFKEQFTIAVCSEPGRGTTIEIVLPDNGA